MLRCDYCSNRSSSNTVDRAYFLLGGSVYHDHAGLLGADRVQMTTVFAQLTRIDVTAMRSLITQVNLLYARSSWLYCASALWCDNCPDRARPNTVDRATLAGGGVHDCYARLIRADSIQTAPIPACGHTVCKAR